MLSGSLEAFALVDVLRLVSGSRVSGRLEVTRGDASGSFLLSGGHVVGVARPGADAAGPDEAIDLALALLDAASGSFEMHAGETVAGPLDLPVGDLLDAVATRRVVWQQAAEAIGSLDAPLELSPEPPSEETTVTAAEWRILLLLWETRVSARSLARMHGEAHVTISTLSEMARKRLIACSAAEPAPDAASPGGDLDAETVTRSVAESELRMLASAGDRQADDDSDPARLLRELMEDEPPAPKRSQQLFTREEQRLRLRR